MKNFLEKQFKLTDRKTTISREVIAGITTFSTLAYIIFVNPAVLSKTGMDYEAVLVATCLAGALGSLLIGLLTNYPFAQAPGMGLNAFFTYTVVLQLGYSWQQALAIVFISGLLFLILTITGLRSKIVNAFPPSILHAIPAGIGFFIALIGLNSAGIIDINQGPIIDIILSNQDLPREEIIGQVKEAPPQVLQFGDFTNSKVLLAILGFFVMILLMIRQVKGSILISIILLTLIGILLGENHFPERWFSMPDLSLTWMQLDFSFMSNESGGFSWSRLVDVITIILAFALVDLFDSIGTLIGTADKGGFLDDEGKLPKLNKALMADATASVAGALMGTSTTTTYIESATGIAEGGRTGLVSVVVSILFLLCIFISPVASMVPGFATAPALIIVGILMISSIKRIDWNILEVAIPSFLVIAIIPFAYGIADGIGVGIIAYTFIQLIRKDRGQISILLSIISILFILKFCLLT